jgi:hypothetical protein
LLGFFLGRSKAVFLARLSSEELVYRLQRIQRRSWLEDGGTVREPEENIDEDYRPRPWQLECPRGEPV